MDFADREKVNLLQKKPRADLTYVNPKTGQVKKVDISHKYLSEWEINFLEEWEMIQGPFSLIMSSIKTGQPILISLRNGHKWLARVKAADRHWNMVLQNVKDMWTDTSVRNKDGSRAKPVNRDRFISQAFLRGDNVIIVVVP